MALDEGRLPFLSGTLRSRSYLDSAEVADSVERLLPPDPMQLDFTRLLLGLPGRKGRLSTEAEDGVPSPRFGPVLETPPR